MGAQKKLIFFLGLGIAVILISCILYFALKPGKDYQSGGTFSKYVCNFNTTQMPIIASLTRGERFRLQGQPSGCSYTLSFQGRDNASSTVRVEQNLLKFSDYRLEPGKETYVQDGLYLQVVSLSLDGVRVAISNDGKYNVGEIFSSLETCFHDPNCRLLCEDFNGAKAKGADCPEGMVPLQKTKIIDKFAESEQDCCLSYIDKQMVFTNKEVYYGDEYLRVFYFGNKHSTPCSISFVGPSGRKVAAENGVCVSFAPVISYSLKANIGDEFGAWKVLIEPEDGEKIEVPFTYSGNALISLPFKIAKGASFSTNFMGTDILIEHISGCDSSLLLKISFLNQTKNYSVIVGDTFPLLGPVGLIITGSMCGKNSNMMLRMVAAPKCPNGYCEAGEYKEKCPWDCLKPMKSAGMEESAAGCTIGCLFGNKCLAEGSEIIIDSLKFTCSSKKLLKV